MAGKCENESSIFSRLPSKLVSYLMPFQREGVRFAIEKDGKCLIADEMGLGKTIQAISTAYFYRDEWPLLIIVPSSLRYPWVEELEKWLPDVHPHDINMIQNGSDASGISSAKVSVVTFGLLSKKTSVILKEALMAQKFSVVIVDESHYIRNFKTASCRSVVPLVKQAKRRILLSGTPALAKPVELYPQLEALCPGKFGNWWTFTSRYCDAQVQFFGKQRRRRVDGASHLEELQSKLTSAVMIRREKKDVLTQLPPKQRQRILFDLKESELKRDIIDTFEQLQPYLTKAGPDLNNAASISMDIKQKNNKKTTKHRKSSSKSEDQKQQKEDNISDEKETSARTTDCKTSDVTKKGLTTSGNGSTVDKTEEAGVGEGRVTMLSMISKLYKLSGEAKIGPVKDYVQLLCENPNLKFLIFAYHHCMMNGIQQTLWDSKVKFIRIDGNTKPSERLYFVQQFQSDPTCRVAILSILAAGVGLTFTAAKLVVFAEMYWTPGVMVQCEDRAHRIGQTSCVPVHYLVAKGTMDEWVWSAVCKKTTVVTATLNGRVQSLDAGEGDKYQVEVLSNAEAWVPSEDQPQIDISSFFLSQLPPSQRSIKDFFANSPSMTSSQQSTSSSNERSHSNSTKRASANENIKDKKERNVIHITLNDSEDEDANVASSHFDSLQVDSTEITSPHDQYQAPMSPLIHEDRCSPLNPSNEGSVKRKRKLETKDGEVKRYKTTSSHPTSSLERQCSHIVTLIDVDDMDGEDFTSRPTRVSRAKTQNCQWPISPDSPDTSADNPVNKMSQRRPLFNKTLQKDNLSEGTDSVPLQSELQVNKGNISMTIAATSSNSGKWDCTVCTYLNHPSLPYCEMCDTSNKKKALHSGSNVIKNKNLTDTTSENNKNHSHEHVSKRADHGCHLSINDSTSFSCTNSRNGGISSLPCYSAGQEETAGIHCKDKQSQKLLTDCDDTSEVNNREVVADHGSDAESNYCSSVVTTDSKHSVYSDSADLDSDCVESDSSDTELPTILYTSRRHRNKSVLGSNEENISIDQFDSDSNGSEDLSKDAEKATAADVREPFCTPSYGKSETNITSPSNEGKTTQSADSISRAVNSSAIISAVDEDITNTPPSPNQTSLTEETQAAKLLFSPVCLMEDRSCEQWLCPDCNTINAVYEEDCEGCLSSRPQHTLDSEARDTKKQERVVNLDRILAYKSFYYCCSKYTGRVYLFDETRQPLNVNFLPLDVTVGNVDDLPDLLLHPDNLRVVRRFLHEWNSSLPSGRHFTASCQKLNTSQISVLEKVQNERLSETKKRFIIKHTDLFKSPLQAYELIRSGKSYCVNRHLTKESLLKAAISKAEEVNGTVRVVNRPCPGDGNRSTTKNPSQNSPGQSDTRPRQGLAQVLGEDGVPLCVYCHKPYQNPLLQDSTIQRWENAWYTRFCSPQCTDSYWMRTHNDYCRGQVYQTERGICQLCKVDAHALYIRIKHTIDLKKRAELIRDGTYKNLSNRQKENIVKNPTPGQFWHVDHIVPVWEGGGECDIDNLRTLCTVCHHRVTAEQTKRRAKARKLGDAVSSRDITAFFKPC